MIGVVSVFVCVCVDVCIHFRCFWLHFNFILGLLLDHLGWFGALCLSCLASIFWVFCNLEGYQGLPWALRGPLGRQGVPKKGPMSEKLVRWTPLGLPV